MRIYTLALCGVALLVAGCNQTSSVETASTAAAPSAPATSADSVVPTMATPPVNDTATTASVPTAASPKPQVAETLNLSFSFKPAPNPDDPEHPKTSAYLKVQGSKPQEIELGKFAGKPDVVDAGKARQAGFPSGMVLGFRSYEASSGTSSDLAVLNVGGQRLRIVQRRVEETAAQPGVFETSREIPLPPNALVVAGVAKK